MGESVESQFVAWSNAGIGTTPLHLGLSDELTQEFNTDVENHTHGAACAISVVKGFTTYGIGNVAASICKYILFDNRTIRLLSFYQLQLPFHASGHWPEGRIARCHGHKQKSLEDCAEG
jgi:L-lactate dehydrogenase